MLLTVGAEKVGLAVMQQPGGLLAISAKEGFFV